MQRELMSEPACRFASLVVRRLDNGGVCLQGVMEADELVPDVCAIAQRRACAMCIDILDILRFHTGILQRSYHNMLSA